MSHLNLELSNFGDVGGGEAYTDLSDWTMDLSEWTQTLNYTPKSMQLAEYYTLF